MSSLFKARMAEFDRIIDRMVRHSALINQAGEAEINKLQKSKALETQQNGPLLGDQSVPTQTGLEQLKQEEPEREQADERLSHHEQSDYKQSDQEQLNAELDEEQLIDAYYHPNKMTVRTLPNITVHRGSR